MRRPLLMTTVVVFLLSFWFYQSVAIAKVQGVVVADLTTVGTVETASTVGVAAIQVVTDTAAMTETTTWTDTSAMTYTITMTDTGATTATPSIETETVVPSVTVNDQESTGANVTVAEVVAAEPGWMVIHADAEGRPGPVLGQTSVPAGTTENVVVVLDEPISGATNLWAMLHIDAGVVGEYEFPGADSPVIMDGAIVMAPLTATGAAAVAAAPAATPTVVEEEAPASAPAATPTVVEEEAPASAPQALPVTGTGSTDALQTALPVVLLILVALAASAIAIRRRTA